MQCFSFAYIHHNLSYRHILGNKINTSLDLILRVSLINKQMHFYALTQLQTFNLLNFS